MKDMKTGATKATREAHGDYPFADLAREYEEIALSEQAPVAKLGLYATASLKHVDRYRRLYREAGTVVFSSIDQHTDDGTSWYWKTAELFAATLDEAVLQKTIREVNTLKVGTMFLDAIHALMQHQLSASTAEHGEDDVRDLMDLYLNGLIP